VALATDPNDEEEEIMMDNDTICHTISKASAAFPPSIFPITAKIC